MIHTDTSERGLERLICTALTGSACDPETVKAEPVHERPAAYGAGWIGGAPEDYDREHCARLPEEVQQPEPLDDVEAETDLEEVAADEGGVIEEVKA